MNKTTNKELPQVEPVRPQPKMDVRTTIAREIQAAEEVKQRYKAVGFLDKFLALFADYSYRTSYHHKRKPAAVSTRSPAVIVNELRAFYEQRPRPWRPTGSRQRPIHATRFRYRRTA